MGLGVLRLLAVKYVVYHEQPTEHGTHWNFFLTLFSVWQVGEGAAGVVRRLGWLPLLFSVAALSAGYELCLIFKDLGPAILHHPRPDAPSCTSYWNCALEWVAWFVWHNREGIVSIWSHSLLYIIAAGSARLCGLTENRNNTSTTPGAWGMLRRLSALSCAFGGLSLFLHLGFGLSSSRRQGNALFALVVLALTCLILSMLQLVQIVSRRESGKKLLGQGRTHHSRSLLDYFAQHSLQAFILSNLVTGLVNLALREGGTETYHVGHISAMTILLAYCCLLCWVVVNLHFLHSYVFE